MKTKNIDKEKWYSLFDLIRMNILWVKSPRTVREFVVADMKGKNILKAKVIGKGNGKRYHIKGENIIKIIE